MGPKLTLGMETRQEMRLAVTQQLQLAIKLLQMTRMELQEVITKELEINPTLEESESEAAPEETDWRISHDGYGEEPSSPPPEEPSSHESGSAPSFDEEERESSDFGEDSAIPEGIAEIDQVVASDLNQVFEERPGQPEMDWETYFDTYMDGPSDIQPRETGGEEDERGVEHFYAQEQTLFDYLMWQLKFSSLPPDQQKIGAEIIGDINEDGYLGYKDDKGIFHPILLEEIAARIPAPVAEVDRVHQHILRFDPIGVGALSLKECLLIQARFGPHSNPLLARIIQDHWELVEKGQVPRLAAILRLEKEKVEEVLRSIRLLDPRPGTRFASTRTEYIIPDIFVTKVGDDYHVSLNEDGLPQLRVNAYYRRALQNRMSPKETRKYIREKINAASWLIKSIQQRQRTIRKVTEAIVARQREFLDKGVEHLRPMVLRDIAEIIGMHECTVSRVTTSKYVHTPQGIFELKYFFNSGITNSQGEDIAAETIRSKIRQFVEKEDDRKPLSDEKLVSLLKQEGIDVARRTVAKYREGMGILSSAKRKKNY